MPFVETVKGPMDTAQLGSTLMHEHVFVVTPEIEHEYPEWSWDGSKQDRQTEAIGKLQALKAAGIIDLFDTVVDGHVVKERHLAGKPAPDSYLEGAKELGVEPAHAVVVEDALAGVEAGRAGHFALVVGVDNHDETGSREYADQLHDHGADVVVTDLAELLAERPAH